MKKDVGKWIKNYEIMSFDAEGGARLQRKSLGKTSSTAKVIDYDDLDGSLGACGGDDVGAELGASIMRGNPVMATKIQSWEVTRFLLSSSPTGMIYVARDGGKQIQTFDINGNKKMETNTTTNKIQGMTCHHAAGQDTLVLAMPGKIELRDAVRGNLLDSLDIHGFMPSRGICQDSQETVLIGGKIGQQQKAMQFIIKQGKITKGNKQINIQLPSIRGLTSITHDNKKYVIATSFISNSIVAIAFDTGAEVWMIKDAVYNGKQVEPWGICTDGGSHLLLADCRARRILVLDVEGRIKRALITNIPDYCFHVTYIRSIDKLAVTFWSSGVYNVTIYGVIYDG